MLRLGAGLTMAGIDARFWVSRGTVAAVNGEQPDYTDPNAVVISPSGVDVDVVLEPSGVPITCHYGHQAGAVSVLFPIRPGNQVLVAIPGGDLAMIPYVLCVVAGASEPLPVETDGKPVFRNDRASIFARGVPIEVRTAAGAVLRLEADGSASLASAGKAVVISKEGEISLGKDAQQHLLLGDAYREAQATQSAAILAGLAALIAVAVGPLGALQPGLQALQAAWQAFEAQSTAFLSVTSKSE